MNNEAEIGSAEPAHSGRRAGRSGGESAPLQSRAHFLQNWAWPSVTQINQGLCERGRAQRGINSETHRQVEEDWEKVRSSELTLLETFQFLKSCHRRAPFLFFNGNTFAEIGRALANALLSDLPLVRRKEASSAVAHFITGVLNQDLMVAAIDSLWKAASFAPGDRVKTLRGTTHGVVLRLADDGRVVWRQDGGSAELVALPEGLLRLQ